MYQSHHSRVGLSVLLAAIITAVLLVIVQFMDKPKPKVVETIETTDVRVTPNIEITRLTSEVDHGLNLVQVNDSLTLLIYRGTESVSMIQIK